MFHYIRKCWPIKKEKEKQEPIPNRREAFSLACDGDVNFPPNPVITRWGTWLEASSYYYKYFELIKNVVNELDSAEAECIKAAQHALVASRVRENLLFIETHFNEIPGLLISIQKWGLSSIGRLGLIGQLTEKFENIPFVNSNGAIIVVASR